MWKDCPLRRLAKLRHSLLVDSQIGIEDSRFQKLYLCEEHIGLFRFSGQFDMTELPLE
jgi:hypothetical protein